MIFREIETAAGYVTVCLTGKESDLVADSFAQTYRNIRQKLNNRCSILWAEQVHGNSVIFCEGTLDAVSCLGEGDAIIACRPGIAPLVRTADCIPILVYAESSAFVAAVHAGWRGLKKQVLSQTLAKSHDLGINVGDLRFVVGPFIRENSYEVGGEVAGQFAAGFSKAKPDGKFLLDLKRILQAEMESQGILSRQVTWFDDDTLTSPAWFSARRGEQGRNMALVFYST